MTPGFDALVAAANRTGRPLAEVVRHHFLEAVLRRLAGSGGAAGFVLRGSMLTRAWAAPFPRPAADLDFAGAFEHDVADTADRFLPCLAADPADGVRFDPAAAHAKGIWQESRFPGVRLSVRADVFGEPQATTIDVGFGDPLVPPPERLDYPALVGPPVPVLAVHPATLIGWKLHGLAEWGVRRWRPKDVLDLWLLAARFAPPAGQLAEAIVVAFESRGYPAAEAGPTLTAPGRWDARSARARWDEFRRQRPDVPVPESLPGVIGEIAGRLGPALALLPT